MQTNSQVLGLTWQRAKLGTRHLRSFSCPESFQRVAVLSICVVENVSMRVFCTLTGRRGETLFPRPHFKAPGRTLLSPEAGVAHAGVPQPGAHGGGQEDPGRVPAQPV